MDALVFKTMVGRKSQVGSIPMRSRHLFRHPQLFLVDHGAARRRFAHARPVGLATSLSKQSAGLFAGRFDSDALPPKQTAPQRGLLCSARVPNEALANLGAKQVEGLNVAPAFAVCTMQQSEALGR